MKIYTHIFFALLALASCTRELEGTDVCEPAINLGVTFSTKAPGSGSDSIGDPVINSMRVLIFYGADAGSETPSNLVFNTFYAFGFGIEKGSGKYTVNLANQIVLPKSDCRNYNVYVVLNEEGFSLSGATPTDLHTALGDFTGNETALQSILCTPAVYAEVLKNVNEPAFLISGYKAVNFGSGELGRGKNVVVDGANGFNRGRSMAQIVIDRITSEPAPGVDDYSSIDVPRIFVKSVTLENVPNTIAWSDSDGSTNGNAGTKMDSQQVGSANSDGYYTRDWYGHITRTITNLFAQKVQYTDAKFYRTYKNENVTGQTGTDAKYQLQWSFITKPFRTDDNPTVKPPVYYTPWTYEYAAGKDYEISKGVKPAAAINAIKGLEAWDKGEAADKSNYILSTQLPGVFDALQDDNEEMSENISYTSYEVTGVQSENKNGMIKTSIGPTILSDDYWTVRLGDKFYVPENIQDATANATCLHVTLAIADPKFSFSLNKDAGKRVATEDCNDKNSGDKIADNAYKAGYNYVDPATLPSPSKLMDDESGLTYAYYVGDGDTGNLELIKDIDGAWVKNYGSVVWADDETHKLTLPLGDKNCDDHIYDSENGTGGYYVYIDGFSRRTEAVQTGIVVNETLKGAYFDWNVNAATHVYDFVIPVNNNLGNDGDYSVRRNTRYTVTLYVSQGTYDSLETKAGAPCPFTLTAKVETETVSCDEE